MKRILWDDRGYALVLTLLFMPVFVGLSLVIIDLGRGNNAHSDLYAAADAMALAAAGELDGGPDSITRAKEAMAEIRNSVSFLSLEDGEFEITLGYVDEEGNAFNVVFLTDIPASDEDPIDQDWVDNYGTLSGQAAKYVYVAAQSRDLDTIFPVPISFADQDVPVQAKAVAGRRSAVCKITPLFICNPFEGGVGGVDDLPTAFSEGKLHGRLIKMIPGGSQTAGPGNFGFLGEDGNDTLREYFASDGPPVCFDEEKVITKPGGNSVAPGLNVRFDIWDPPFQNAAKGWGLYPSAKNVRKGYWNSKANPQTCDVNLYDKADDPRTKADPPVPVDPIPYSGFPENYIMDTPEDLGTTTFGTPGAFLGRGNWDWETYFLVNHGIDLREDIVVDATTTPITTASNPDFNSAMYDELMAASSLNQFKDGVASSPGANMPSRYDIYRYELDNPALLSNESPGFVFNGKTYDGESGNAVCRDAATEDPGRRILQAAIVDCLAASDAKLLNGRTAIPVVAYASIFLTHPMESGGGADSTINGEIIDITGSGGLGTLDEFIRVEAVLVR